MRVLLVAGLCWSCIIFIYWLQGFCNATPVNRAQHGACKRLWPQGLTLKMMPCYYMCVIYGRNGPIHTEIRREVDGTPCWDHQYGNCIGGICWKRSLSESTKSTHGDRLQTQEQILHRKKRDTYIGPDTEDEEDDWGETLAENPTSWPAEGTSSQEEEDEEWDAVPPVSSLAPGLKDANLTPGLIPEKNAPIPKAGLLPNGSNILDGRPSSAAASNQSHLTQKSTPYKSTSLAAGGSREPGVGVAPKLQQQASPSTVNGQPLQKQRRRRKFRRGKQSTAYSNRQRGRKRRRKNGKRPRAQRHQNTTTGAKIEDSRIHTIPNFPASIVSGPQSQESKGTTMLTPDMGPHSTKSLRTTTEQEQQANKKASMATHMSKVRTRKEKPEETGTTPVAVFRHEENGFNEKNNPGIFHPTSHEIAGRPPPKTQSAVISSTLPTLAAQSPTPPFSKHVSGPRKSTLPQHLPLQPVISIVDKGPNIGVVSEPTKTTFTAKASGEATGHALLKDETAPIPPALTPTLTSSAGKPALVNVPVTGIPVGAIAKTASLKSGPGRMTPPHLPSQPLSSIVDKGPNIGVVSETTKNTLIAKPSPEATGHALLKEDTATIPPAISPTFISSAAKPALVNVPVTGMPTGAITKTGSLESGPAKMTPPQHLPLQPVTAIVDKGPNIGIVSESTKTSFTAKPSLEATGHALLKDETATILPASTPTLTSSAGKPAFVNRC
ncbi:uncharacterized protein LOC119391768 [Rhipicephalus sanguineus]|uniref:uncharacterized protein LOC119391768 n=1 Tax=Rhipicephalus sanguineus TaxID=34632 RepID=UPI0020C31779|nr:uncharacterized protein LOC119391768 [Rhipicephalus sanguineus]